MADLVGTCPKDFWEEWIAEGDAAGDPETGEEWGWYTNRHLWGDIKPGDRFYVVAHGKLRGYSIVTRVGELWRRLWAWRLHLWSMSCQTVTTFHVELSG